MELYANYQDNDYILLRSQTTIENNGLKPIALLTNLAKQAIIEFNLLKIAKPLDP